MALGDVVARVTRELARAIAEARASVTFAPLPTVRGDAAQIQRLLASLVGNALKFRRPGAAPHVHLSAGRDGGRWEIAVADDGVGVPPADAERIFVLFQRLHGVGEFPGNGIGLAVCRRIVERHGGLIRVESRPDAGATFRFTLPAAEESLP